MLLGILCWIKALIGFSGPLSEDSPLPYRFLVVVLLPLVLGVWIKGLLELSLGKARSLGRLGLGVAWLGIAYVVLAGLEQYFVDLVPIGIPWAGAGYLAVILGVLLVGIALLVSKVLPPWSRGLPLVLGLPLPLLILARNPEDSAVLWISFALATGAGFLLLGWVLLDSAGTKAHNDGDSTRRFATGGTGEGTADRV